MVRKIGFRPDIPAEYTSAMDIYAGDKVKLVTNSTSVPKYDPAEYFCLMN